jgi:trans-aconitate 2-methyltransferase
MQVCDRPRWRAAFADFATPFVHVDPAGYHDLAASAGLLVTAQVVSDVEWDFGSREAFVRWCTVGFADWAARLGAAEIVQWVDDVVTAYEDTVGAAGLFRFMQLRAELTPQS